MGRFARLIEESNPDAPRYVANAGKYAITDALQEAGMEVDIKEFYPIFYVTIDRVKYEVWVKEAPKAQPGEEEELLAPDEEQALNMSRRLSTQPKGGFLGINTPQGKMDKAYGDMMSKVSKKVTDIARRL